MILGRPWLTKSHVRNYWGERYMIVRVHLRGQKVPFANFVKILEERMSMMMNKK